MRGNRYDETKVNNRGSLYGRLRGSGCASTPEPDLGNANGGRRKKRRERQKPLPFFAAKTVFPPMGRKEGLGGISTHDRRRGNREKNRLNDEIAAGSFPGTHETARRG